MSLREMWAASFRPPKELWRLEYDDENNLALYVSKTKVIQGKTENMFGRAPIYHVWMGDNWLYCGANMCEAYNRYNAIKRCDENMRNGPVPSEKEEFEKWYGDYQEAERKFRRED